jgi:RNA polymerase sigma factor (sigma-70 family)
MADEPDNELIRDSILNPERFSVIFERHYEAVRRYAQRRAGLEAGEEIAARTFESAFAARSRFRTNYPSARPWLLGIATNLVRHHFREEAARLRALVRVGTAWDRPTADELEDVTRKIDSGRLGRDLGIAIMSLDGGDRDVLLLFAWAELSYEEIAVSLHIPIGTVRSRLHRARRRVRELLSDVVSIEDWNDDG